MPTQFPHEPNSGQLRTRIVTNAVAGIDISITLPTTIRAAIYSAQITVTKTGAAATLNATVDFLLAGDRIYFVPGVQFFSGAGTVIWQYSIGITQGAVLNAPVISNKFADKILLPPSTVISTAVTFLTGTDTIDEFIIYGQEWIN